VFPFGKIICDKVGELDEGDGGSGMDDGSKYGADELTGMFMSSMSSITIVGSNGVASSMDISPLSGSKRLETPFA
jgi:hypothetical protein